VAAFNWAQGRALVGLVRAEATAAAWSADGAACALATGTPGREHERDANTVTMDALDSAAVNLIS
jgi:hypothetical protein